MPRRCYSLAAVVALLLAAAPIHPATGQEFRIDTEIFVGEEKEPALTADPPADVPAGPERSNDSSSARSGATARGAVDDD